MRISGLGLRGLKTLDLGLRGSFPLTVPCRVALRVPSRVLQGIYKGSTRGLAEFSVSLRPLQEAMERRVSGWRVVGFRVCLRVLFVRVYALEFTVSSTGVGL